MGLIYNKALNLTEKEVRYAMANTNTNPEAARFCGCTILTWTRYAKMYYDYDEGKSLFQMQTEKGYRYFSKNRTNPKTGKQVGFQKTDIFEILEGKHPSYNGKKLAKRLLFELIFPPECCLCGIDERRVTDQKLPLIMRYKDDDLRNHKKENLEFICYNCYFLNYGTIHRCKHPKNF